MRTIICIIIVAAILSGCSVGNNPHQVLCGGMLFSSKSNESMDSELSSDSTTQETISTEEWIRIEFEKNRPAQAFEIPVPSDDITNVRVSIVDRTIKLPETLSSLEPFRNLSHMQIWYGFEINGEWHDYPCENYDLMSLVNKDRGYDAAGSDHIVKIGKYVLICITQESTNAEQQDTYCKFSDTLGSKAKQLFAEYYTTAEKTSNEPRYAYFKEQLIEDGVAYSFGSTFPKFYYILLEYDNLPSNYKLNIYRFSKGLPIWDQITYEAIGKIG